MAKKAKKKVVKKNKKEEEPLAIHTSFAEVIKIAVTPKKNKR